MKLTLAAAAVYNVVWAAWVVLWPNAMFEMLDMPVPRYPMIWQCVGMIVGAYGIGYAIAATSPIRWWPLVLVGLIGKVAGPIGFVQTAMAGDLPWRFGWTILTNDLIWWWPFAAILLAAWRHNRAATPSNDLHQPKETRN
ncbi:MAG: alkyl hydroperoxide reductase [Phycisphaeraceae bacterium]